MADAVTSALTANGRKNWSYVFTNESDSTGETGVVKVDGSAAGPLGVFLYGQNFYPLAHIKILEIEYSVFNMGVEVIWDATTSKNAVILNGFGKMSFHAFGGLAAVDATGALLAGATGKIKFTTIGAAAGSSYTIYMRGSKGIPSA